MTTTRLQPIKRHATDQWFSLGTLVSSTNKTYRRDITEIFLKVALDTINHKQTIIHVARWHLDGHIRTYDLIFKEEGELINRIGEFWLQLTIDNNSYS